MGKSVSNRDANLGVIVEAKQQYTKQLMNIMKPVIYDELFAIYTKAVDDCENTNDLLVCFQNELKQVPKWNADVIKEATNKLLKTCSYFNDLITAVFLSNVRILTSVKLGSSKKRKVQLVVPTNETFVHKVYVNVSRTIYNDPFTFSNKRYNGNVLRNMNEVLPLIELSIEDTIRDMLPIQNILESYLGDTMSDSDSEDDEGGSEAEDPYHEPFVKDHEPFDKDHEEPVSENHEEPVSEDEEPASEDHEPVSEDHEPVSEDHEPVSEEASHSGNDFFAKPTQELESEIKDIPLGKKDPEKQKKPTTFFDDVEDE